jgi:hypothetical protein
MNINNFLNIDYSDIWVPSIINNGRIDILNNNDNKKVKTFTKSILNDNNTNSISQNLTNTDVSLKYFSKENINKIQTAIIMDVYSKSNKEYLICKQSEQELIIIMRSYYLQYSKNLPTNVYSQIEELNNMVISWSVDEIIKNIRQYVNYKKTCSTLPMPMERSQLPSQKGTKILEIKSFI